jgi:acyl-CoA thioesterase I
VNFSKLRIFLLALISAVLASISFASAQIVALGSSTVHGAVAEGGMWPAVLQGMLRARGS